MTKDAKTKYFNDVSDLETCNLWFQEEVVKH